MLTIVLPYLPPKELSPNAGKKWNVHKINRITREAQEDVIARVFEQQPRGKPLERATVTVTFVVPDLRRRDKDNLIAASKAWRDGLVKAGVIADDSWGFIREVYPDIVYSKGESKTIIEVTDA